MDNDKHEPKIHGLNTKPWKCHEIDLDETDQMKTKQGMNFVFDMTRWNGPKKSMSKPWFKHEEIIRWNVMGMGADESFEAMYLGYSQWMQTSIVWTCEAMESKPRNQYEEPWTRDYWMKLDQAREAYIDGMIVY